MGKIDLAKRRRVMQLSQKLGHCICKPRQSCPCDVFTNQGICPCAGERPDPAPSGTVKLTQLVRNAGCASKIPAAELEAVLARLPKVDDPNVLSGLPAGDDAGVYRLSDGLHLVQTVDVFTPCSDDPYTFGRICAANCLSDIYAMGAQPRTALSILCFPSDSLDGDIMYSMLKGAMDSLAEAGVALIGGHSIEDDEIKLGFAVTGVLEGGAAVSHETAAVGDVLVLTKPLGSGVLGFCRQIGRTVNSWPSVEQSMAELNRLAAEAMRAVGASACTDVTGFGLLGHLVSMVRHSGVTAEVYAEALPAFDGALEALRDGVITGAIERNRQYVADDIAVAEGADEAMVNLGFDAQTSGGLLISVPQKWHEALMSALTQKGVTAWTVGRIAGQSSGRIVVTRKGKAAPVIAETPIKAGESRQSASTGTEPCCDESQISSDDKKTGIKGDIAHAAQAFGTLMKVTAAGGAIDSRTKELINFALAVLSRCGPCLVEHVKKAHGMGIAREQLDEAAWCAVAMGGAPVRMFYQSMMEEISSGGSKGCCS